MKFATKIQKKIQLNNKIFKIMEKKQGMRIVAEFLNKRALVQVELETYKIEKGKLVEPRYFITTFFRTAKKVHQTETMDANEAMNLYGNIVKELQR